MSLFVLIIECPVRPILTKNQPPTMKHLVFVPFLFCMATISIAQNLPAPIHPTSPIAAPYLATAMLSESPLAACPETPNCVHQAYVYPQAPSELAGFVVQALESRGANSITKGAGDSHEISAVFKAWQYQDDVQVAIQSHEDGSILYIRSASREGHWDLGVNGRRVKGIVKALNRLVD